MLLRRVSTVALAVVALLATSARAENRSMAEQYYRLGEKAYEAQNFVAAAANFEEAYKNFQRPEIAFSAAQAYRRLYRLDPNVSHVQKAVDHYKFYIDKVRTGGRVADAMDALAEMQHELDKLIASGATVSPELAKEYTRIVINPSLGKETTSSSALQEVKEGGRSTVVFTATIDGKPAHVYEQINVLPKVYKIVVSADGYFPGETTWKATQGLTSIVNVKLEPKPAKVTVVSDEGARVSVDGRPIGTAPLAPLELAAGRHVITISLRGHEPVAREVVVTRAQELTLRESLHTTRRRQLVPWILTGGAFAATIFIVSTSFALIRDGDGKDLLRNLHEDGGWTADDKEKYDRTRDARDNWRLASFVSGGLLIGLGATAAVFYYMDNPSPDRVRVEPMMVPGGGGAAIAGGF